MAQTPLTQTVFQGNVKSGLETGNPSTDTRANAALCRSATVSAASSANIMLPGDATNVDFTLYVTTGSAGQTAKVNIGNINDPTHFAGFTQVSAQGIYRQPQTVSAPSLLTQAGSDNLMIVRGSALQAGFLGRLLVTFNRGI